MTIAVLADESIKKEWLSKGVPPDVEVLWCGSVKTLVATVAEVYMDLLYEFEPERTAIINIRSGFPFFINAVQKSTKETGTKYIRINAWPGFLQRSVVEIAPAEPQQEAIAKMVLDKLHWNYQVVPDIPGMITARIIASIINEAYYTYGDGISTKQEIDIAMKLGTSYPFGPFEWAEKIGLDKIYGLLNELSKNDMRYAIAPALEEEMKMKESTDN